MTGWMESMGKYFINSEANSFQCIITTISHFGLFSEMSVMMEHYVRRPSSLARLHEFA